MREGFEDTLRDYNSELKEFDPADRSEYGMDDMGEAFDKAARSYGTTYKAQEEIFKLQEKKLAVMDTLKKQLRSIEDIESDGRVDGGSESPTLSFDPEDKVFTYEDEEGETVQLSKGELLTDMEWGLTYTLTKDTPRVVRKRYAIELAKYKLRTLLDEQIISNEKGREDRASSRDRRTPYGRRNSPAFFHTLDQDREHALERHDGILAEKMVRLVLKKLSIDYKADFTLIEADLHQDTIEKIDFIIRRTASKRRVGVDAAEHQEEPVRIKDIAVQFTTDTRTETTAHKQGQLANVKSSAQAHVDDHKLVSVELRHIRNLYDTWSKNPSPGGPEKGWSSGIKAQIVREVLKDIVPQDEIDRTIQAL